MHTANVIENTLNDWSAYRDESWQGAPPGTWGMQPRVLHLIKNLGYTPEEVPASNIIFLRSRRESSIRNQVLNLANECWPFHQAVIEKLTPEIIVCFGKTSGKYVCKKLGAKKQIDEFIETNNRKWRSTAYISANGTKVIVATHPSIADWAAKNTDPIPMINKVFQNF